MFDTGSKSIIISAGILDELRIDCIYEPTTKTLVKVEGGNLDVLGTCKIDCKFGYASKEVVFTVIGEDNIAILGLDDMNKFGIEINTTTQTLTCGELTQNYKLTNGQMGEECSVFLIASKEECNVRLAHDELIPGKGYKIVEAEIFKNIPETPVCLLELDFAANRYGTVIPACVVDTDKTVHFLIHNLLDSPVSLKRHATMGVATPTIIEEKSKIDLLSDLETSGSPDGHPLDQLPQMSHLTKEQREEVEKLVLKYHTLFSRSDDDIGNCTLGPVRLPLKENYKVVKEPMRRYNHEQREAMQKHVEIMAERGIIEPSSSEWRSFPVLAPKKRGEKIDRHGRFACDLRKVNLQMKDGDTYSRSLPRIQDIFDSISHNIAGAKDVYFGKLDISQAFHCVEVAEEDRDPLTFAAPTQLWRYRKLANGVKSAPSQFQSLMEKALFGLIFLMCYVFLDDVLVVGRTWREFMQNLENVFHRLIYCGFKLKCSKTEIGHRKISILGFQISKDGIDVCPIKQRAASLWAKPKTQKECLSFVQFCNYMRRHIEKFSFIAKPLYDMCASASFYWNEECENAFLALKNAVVSAKALRLPDFSKTLYLTSDFCQKACAYALLQRENDTSGSFYAILYGSKTMTNQHYPSSKGELVSLKTAIVETRPYLHAATCYIVYTDHRSLTHLLKKTEISAFCLRMIEEISEMGDFTLIYVPGSDKRICIVDRLSRAKLEVAEVVTWATVCGDKLVVSAVTTRSAGRRKVNHGNGHPEAISSEPAPSDDSSWSESQSKDEDLVKVKRWLKKGQRNEEDIIHCSPALRSYYMNFEVFLLIANVIFRIWTISSELTRNLVVVPFYLIQQVLHEAHDLSGHIGETKTLLKLRERVFWYGMAKDVSTYIKSCEICIRRMKGKAKAKLEPIYKSFVNEFVFMDIKVLTNYPSGEYKAILIIVEGFSKHTTLVALKTHESAEIMSKVWQHYITKYGAPLNIVTDREKGFLAKIAMDFYELLGIRKRNTVAHRPEADGQSEAYVKIVSKIMTALLMTDSLQGEHDIFWHKRLPYIEYAINSTPSTATNLSPYYIITGRDMIVPSSLFHDIPQERKSVPESVRELRKRQKGIFDRVLDDTEKNALNFKRLYDKKVTENEEKYEEGEKVVYLNYKSHSLYPPSFSPKYLDTVFTVVRKLGVNYLISAGDQEKIVHFNQLKKYIEGPLEQNEERKLRDKIARPKRLGFNCDNDDNTIG